MRRFPLRLRIPITAVAALAIALLSLESSFAQSFREFSTIADRVRARHEVRLRMETHVSIVRAVAERLRLRRQQRIVREEGNLASLREEIVALVSAERAKEHMPPLFRNPFLERAAQDYAEDMAARQFFTHEDPDGRRPVDRIEDAGYTPPVCECTWTYAVGENLAKGQSSAAEVMRGWMQSPEHRENILELRFQEIGIGYFQKHWVQVFGGRTTKMQ